MQFRYEVIREAMKLQGLTLAKLSKLCGTPESTLKKLVSGDVEDPRLGTIFPPFNMLGLSIDRACGLAPERDMKKEAAEHEVSMVTAIQERLAMQDAELSGHRHTIMEQNAKIASLQATLDARDSTIAGLDQQRARLENELASERKSSRRMMAWMIALILIVVALAALYIWDASNLHKGLTALLNQ